MKMPQPSVALPDKSLGSILCSERDRIARLWHRRPIFRKSSPRLPLRSRNLAALPQDQPHLDTPTRAAVAPDEVPQPVVQRAGRDRLLELGQARQSVGVGSDDRGRPGSCGRCGRLRRAASTPPSLRCRPVHSSSARRRSCSTPSSHPTTTCMPPRRDNLPGRAPQDAAGHLIAEKASGKGAPDITSRLGRLGCVQDLRHRRRRWLFRRTARRSVDASRWLPSILQRPGPTLVHQRACRR
jgi:hypothetical protein